MWVQRKMLLFSVYSLELNCVNLDSYEYEWDKRGISKLYVKVCICFLKCFLKFWVGLCLIVFCFSFTPKVFCSFLSSSAEIATGGGEGEVKPTADLKQCNSVSFGKPLSWFGILLCSLTSSLADHVDFAVRDSSAEAQLSVWTHEVEILIGSKSRSLLS